MYNLVYITRHPLGIVVFMEESEKTDLIQRAVRVEAKEDRRVQKTQQPWLIDPSTLEYNTERAVDPEEVEAYWLQRLSPTPKLFGVAELADMLEETGWFVSDFQKAFRQLQLRKMVANLDSKSKRTKRFVHFEANRNQGENLVRLVDDE